ncbi:MAG: hypothetical protein O7A04_12705 [Acidobacteria bacterium]|nr:hypothetical protein [Acidobacteriota bacterium]
MRVLSLALVLATATWPAAAVDMGEEPFIKVANQIAKALNELDAASIRAVLADEYFQQSLEEEGKTADEWIAEMNQGAEQMLGLMGKVEKVELAELDPPDAAFITLQHERGSAELFLVLDESHRVIEINLRPVEHPEMEHPEEGEEHPEEGEGQAEGEEHPEEGEEHPKEEKPPTVESVARFLEAEVARETAAQGGWMSIEDSESGTTLELKLDKIHRERLAKTSEGTYFVCADFTTPDGKSYDLDFWVKQVDGGLVVAETTIHKEEGRPRYNWVEEQGTWKRKSL